MGSILNFSLMYLLAPTAAAAGGGGGGGGLLQRVFSEQILAGWGAPGRGPALCRGALHLEPLNPEPCPVLQGNSGASGNRCSPAPAS